MATESFDKQLSQMPAEYLECRTFGHRMVPANLDPGRPGLASQVGLMCERGCGTESDVIFHWRSGQRVRRTWYDPDKHYLFVRTGRLNREQRTQIHEDFIRELQHRGLPRPAESRLEDED